MLTDAIVFFFFFYNEMILLVIKIQVKRVQSLENTHFVKITYNLLRHLSNDQKKQSCCPTKEWVDGRHDFTQSEKRGGAGTKSK